MTGYLVTPALAGVKMNRSVALIRGVSRRTPPPLGWALVFSAFEAPHPLICVRRQQNPVLYAAWQPPHRPISANGGLPAAPVPATREAHPSGSDRTLRPHTPVVPISWPQPDRPYRDGARALLGRTGESFLVLPFSLLS